MKVTMSYSGGTTRGRQLAREFDKRGHLHEFYIPSYSRKVHYFPKFMIPTLFGKQEIDVQKINSSLGVHLFRSWMQRTAKARRAKPTERYWICEATDRWVARNLKGGSDILMAEAQIALHTVRRAKELGMITILDRTNSHIAYQSEIMDREHEKFGIKWALNSERVIQKGIREYEEADYIFVLSSFVKRTFLERNVPERKLVCVPSGIDLKPFQQVKKEDDVFRVIYCGALQSKKGTHYLLEAFSDLNLKNAELWLIGSVVEDMIPFLDKYKGRYRHFGYLPNSRLYEYYSQGSVFVLPSLEEGLAKVTIEAMACGLPVIATTNTGAEDVVREGVDGFVIPIRDVDALKEKIRYMYENPHRCREMGQDAKTRVHAEFTLEKYFSRVFDAFTKILTQRGSVQTLSSPCG